MLQVNHRQGRVVLVGAGPGDPDLLTLRAYRLLQEADIIVYDRLVSEDVLNLIPKTVPKVFVGKAPGHHILKQEEINQLLSDLAGKHSLVVRLKGGDPFVFGRGSEEAEFLMAKGVDFDVVPGITAAAGCGAAARIPLTHRGLARSVRFITGHYKEGQGLDIDWPSLSDPEMTVVIYMGLQNVTAITSSMIDAGRAAHTPACAVENGATPKQRIIYTTLEELADTCHAQEFRPPTLLIIGDVIKVAKLLQKTEAMA